MASATLNVTVYGGTAPENILVKLYHGNTVIDEYESNVSFSKKYDDLQPGIYDLYIAGKNPPAEHGATQCELTRDEITLHPPDDSPITKTEKNYYVEFNFSV